MRIGWDPNHWQRESIKLKARIEGTSPKEVRKNALIQGVILALGWEKGDEVPIQIGPESMWLYDDQQHLTTVSPTELPMQFFWNWIKEEAVRAAGLWLVGFPYAPSVVLETIPNGDSDWQLARFTSLSTDGQTLSPRGRPFGSGIFENREEFLKEIRRAVTELEKKGKRITQELVADVLYERDLLSIGSAERQLRRWVREFGYTDWKDLLNCL